MKLIIEINMDNDSFMCSEEKDGRPFTEGYQTAARTGEARAILTEVEREIGRSPYLRKGTKMNIFDSNGNTVGKLVVK